MKNKKGDGLSIQVIIIAVIAMVVLVVLVAIFTGRMSIFGIGLDNTAKTCNELQGNWRDACNSGEVVTYGVTDQKDMDANAGKLCCKSSA